MIDSALDALYQNIEVDRPSILLADEHCTRTPKHSQLSVITNRVDVALRFRDAGFSCVLNDFDFSTSPQCDRIYYRVSKEKALVHYLINESLKRLPIGGRLILSGEKSDGIKTYCEKARAMVGAEKSLRKLSGGALLAVIEKRQEPSSMLDDSDYLNCIDISPQNHVELYSKPGVFGWKKIDKGSALLVEQLPAVLEAVKPRSVLDLGCGYGYLTVMAHQLLSQSQRATTRFVATDNNVTALAACEKNLAVHSIDGEAIAADCADSISEKFNLVICNPPFHKGFDMHGDLTRVFLESAHQHLGKDGVAVFVVNHFIALEQKAKGLFSAIDLLIEQSGFRVYRLFR